MNHGWLATQIASQFGPNGLAQQRIMWEPQISQNSPVSFYLRDAIQHCKNTQVIYAFVSI